MRKEGLKEEPPNEPKKVNPQDREDNTPDQIGKTFPEIDNFLPTLVALPIVMSISVFFRDELHLCPAVFTDLMSHVLIPPTSEGNRN